MSDTTTPTPEEIELATRDKATHEGLTNLIEAEAILRWFAFDHLTSKPMRDVSRTFAEHARLIMHRIPTRSAERTTALRKLLEAKDCAVRAVMVAPVSDESIPRPVA